MGDRNQFNLPDDALENPLSFEWLAPFRHQGPVGEIVDELTARDARATLDSTAAGFFDVADDPEDPSR